MQNASVRKFYGKYYHNLTSHAAPQYRLISGAAANVEDGERFIKSIKSTSNISSNKPEHIIANLFLRFQVEQKTKSSKLTEAQKQENAISKIYREMKNPGNTFISFEYIKNNASQWQAHLERISDYLLPGKGIWWNETDKGIEFYDTDEYFVDHNILPPSPPPQKKKKHIILHLQISNQRRSIFKRPGRSALTRISVFQFTVFT